MPETNIDTPNEPPQSEALTTLPVDISPERAQKVGEYFTQVLDQYGKAAEIPVMGRMSIHAWPGKRADFISGHRRFVIEKIEDPFTAKSGRDVFPETIAMILERNKGSRTKWELIDQFTFNQDSRDRLDYRNSDTLLYSRSTRPLKPGIEGVQSTGRFGNIKVNVTPPTSEGIVATLDNFLATAEDIMKRSKRPLQRAKALGKRASKAILG